MKIIALILMAGLLAGCKSTSSLSVVEKFDAEKYMGTWYEAARYPHRFEKGMSNVSATYSLNEDGTIKVINRGFVDHKDQWKDIEGVAKFKGDKDAGWLKVSFFKPFYASYKIIHLNDAYTEAIVTGPSFSYFWILTREKELPKEELNRLIKIAETKGFDKEKIIIVSQEREP